MNGHLRLIAVCSLFFAAVSPVFAAEATRQVVDDTGKTVTVPGQVRHIADAWYAHHSLLMTLGAGGNIVATVNHPETRPWMFRLQPSLAQALSVHGITFNSEALLARQTDVVFVPAGDGDAPAYRQANIPTLEMRFTDYPSLKKSLLTTAAVLGTPEAAARADAYNRYLDMQLTQTTQRTASLTPAQRPAVLHIASLHPLKIDGSDTLIDQWIQAAGGRNAAAAIKGNLHEISPEMILAWQPDVIILGADAGTLAASDYAALFSALKAVQQKRVYRNPAGVFPWDRYGTEAALQIPWAAKLLHPDLFPQSDMVKITQDFYLRFFGYRLSEAEATRMLKGLGPE
ncbi:MULTISPECIES: ABC transporter substrate-binding protein [Yersiniaceae]|uniref:ABC transporter substrate-binding protein n=1 Tax=Yersiniaceae TaxID=1903411 RepID=UPI0009A17B77|nr:ABC transporter substrate-binding protein [Nissabacter archeti]MDV5141945.1 ABC transporter substrate-binding protein [Chimaeribacter arupi]